MVYNLLTLTQYLLTITVQITASAHPWTFERSRNWFQIWWLDERRRSHSRYAVFSFHDAIVVLCWCYSIITSGSRSRPQNRIVTRRNEDQAFATSAVWRLFSRGSWTKWSQGISRAFLGVPSLLGYVVREVSVSLSSTLSVASLKYIVCAAGEETPVFVTICCNHCLFRIHNIQYLTDVLPEL